MICFLSETIIFFGIIAKGCEATLRSKLAKHWFISDNDDKVAASHHFEMNLNEMIVSEEEQISRRIYVANNYLHIVGDRIWLSSGIISFRVISKAAKLP